MQKCLFQCYTTVNTLADVFILIVGAKVLDLNSRDDMIRWGMTN